VGVFLLASAAAGLAASVGANAPIGFVRATGEFTVDGSQIRDNTTLFNGGVVETGISPSHVILQDGTRVDLGTDSRSRVYRDHVVLERGTVQVHGAKQYPLLANKLSVASPEPFRVGINQSGRVSVTSMDGDAQVKNDHGLLIAMVTGGRTLEFQDAGASAPAQLTGCLQQVGDNYVIRDTTTDVVIQVVGTGLANYVGKSVTITGAPNPGATPITGADHVVQVTTITGASGKGCKTNIAGAAAASAAGAGAAAGGLSTGATIAIVGGVAAAGTVIGLAAAGTFTGGTAAASSGTP
jgi:hypothetical protein